MSVFTDFESLTYNPITLKWSPTEPMPFYLLWEGGPTIVVPTGFPGEYSDPWFVKPLRRFSGLTNDQLAKAGLVHDYALVMGARKSVASAVLYEALRAQGGSLVYCLGAFIGSWVVTST